MSPDQIAALEDRAKTKPPDSGDPAPRKKCAEKDCHIMAETGKEYCPTHPVES